MLIHFADTQAPFSSFDDLIANSALRREMQACCGTDYKKSLPDIFASLLPRLPEARRRAQRLNDQGMRQAPMGRDAPHEINPYLGIIHLLDAIDAF